MRRKPTPPPTPTPTLEPLLLEPLAYCVEDAALVMSLSRTAIFELLKAKLLKSVRRGKRVIIPKASILEYLDKHAA
jgi:excisionase family DNA binding protein